MWLTALESTGATILSEQEELEDLVKNATSIFDFEARDIDGNTVNLERYRYLFTSPASSLLVCCCLNILGTSFNLFPPKPRGCVCLFGTLRPAIQ